MIILTSQGDSNWEVEIVSWHIKSLTLFLDLVNKDMFKPFSLVWKFLLEWYHVFSSSIFSIGHTKSSHIKLKSLWYLHIFISYSINARAISNEVVSLDDLFILNCLVKNEKITLGRFLQWRIWLISDRLFGAICIRCVVTKLAQFFRIDVQNLPSIKPLLFDETFIRNSKKFTSLIKKWVWKHDFREHENVEILFQEIEEYQGEEE